MKKIKITGLLLVFFTIILLHFPLFFEPFFPWSNAFDSTLAANYGSLISGYAGVWLLAINIFLLLYVHFKQNLSEFDRKFYTFLSIHRDNVKNFKFGSYTGINAIEKINMVIDSANVEFRKQTTKTIMECINSSYLLVYFGLNDRSHLIYIRSFESEMKEVRSLWNNLLVHNKLIRSFTINQESEGLVLEGSEQYLSTYFRHLFHISESILSSDILSENQKREYFSILRAQLSIHEQALILINSISKIGESWNRHGIIQKYQLIKNIPMGYFKSFDPKETISGIKWMYE